MSAAYLAIRTLLQLTSDEKRRFPQDAGDSIPMRMMCWRMEITWRMHWKLKHRRTDEWILIEQVGRTWSSGSLVQIVMLSGYFRNSKKWMLLEFCGLRYVEQAILSLRIDSDWTGIKETTKRLVYR